MYLEDAKRDRKCKGKTCPNNNKIQAMQKCLVVEEMGWGNRKMKLNYCSGCAIPILEKELESVKIMLGSL